MLRKISLASTTLLLFFAAKSQDSSKSLIFSGSVDGYYRTTFTNKQNNNTSFTNSNNSFELGMASIRADATALKGKVGATIDLGYGVRADENSYNDGETSAGKNGYLTLALIKQAFITYQATSKLKFTFGKFGTHIGYEVLDAFNNRNYSTSYMFTNGPFFNTGLKADITAGPVAFMIGLSDYTDQTTSTTSARSVIAQFSGGTKNGKLKFFLNYTGMDGANTGAAPTLLTSLNQYDVVINGTVSSKFGIGYNGTAQTRNYISTSPRADGTWIGNALYFNYDPTDKTGLTLRAELITDNSMTLYNAKSIFEGTLSLNKKIGPLTIIPEIRYESAQSAIYLKGDGTNTNSAFNALIAAVYKF